MFYQPNLNALFLNTGALLSLFYFFIPFKERFSKTKNIYYLILFTSFIYMSIITGSRASFVSMLFVMLFFFMTSNTCKMDKAFRKKITLFFIIYLVFALAMMIIPTNVAQISALDKFVVEGGESFSILSRFNIWFTQILLFLDKPLFGWGLDSFKLVNIPYQVKAAEMLKMPYYVIGNFTLGHNELLQLLAEGGLFLIIPLFYLFYNYFKVSLKGVTENSIILQLIPLLFIGQSMFSWPLRHPVLLLFFVIFLGINYSYSLSSRQEKEDLSHKIKSSNPMSKLTSYAGAASACLLSILLLLFISFYGKDLIYEFSHLVKYEKAETIQDRLDILEKVAKSPFHKLGADTEYVKTGMDSMFDYVFDSNIIPQTKEDYEAVNKTNLFNFPEMETLNMIDKKLLYLDNLRPYWLYKLYKTTIEVFKGRYQSAKDIALEGLKLKPDDEALWGMLHFANVLEAARKTGKPVEAFMPSRDDVTNMYKKLKEEVEIIK